ncbi:hypothetical protein Bpfe_006590 [Biomphalaria pfeifferi]|uniref:Uncharacterized protein n=1 Tax=Biomphalaria pfeifferi TaxID=112525 RepID=A0AAD8FGV7_BIOPF|nr:hypothetical protein Bpfe_006590 [Biomphalaria pfeifferi]
MWEEVCTKFCSKKELAAKTMTLPVICSARRAAENKVMEANKGKMATAAFGIYVNGTQGNKRLIDEE